MKDSFIVLLVVSAYLAGGLSGFLLGVIYELGRMIRKIKDAGRERPENDPALKP